MKKVRIIRTVIFILILIPVLIWIALGPGLRFYLRGNGDRITSDIEEKSDGHIRIGSLSGDFWSGFTFERIMVYSDREIDNLPLLSADQITCRLSIIRLLQRNFTPNSVHIDGFNVTLQIDADGKVLLPEWQFRTSKKRNPLLHAGFIQAVDNKNGVKISCDNGVIEIRKNLPGIIEAVDMIFYQVAGNGELIPDEEIRIERLLCEYLTTPITLEGFYPLDSSDSIDIDISCEPVNLRSVFRDLDPLFRNSEFLPEGKVLGEIRFDGPIDRMMITGNMRMNETVLGNISIDDASGAFAYSAGVIDLTGVSADAYGGNIEGSCRINLLSEIPNWSAVCNFESIDVPDYLSTNGYLKYEMTGEFFGSVRANGDFTSADALTCTVTISSNGGRFLTPFSDRFMTITHGIPNDSPITDEDLADYSDLEVRARITESIIRIQRFHFVSEDLQIESNGEVGFDKTISADGGISVPIERARRHPKFGSYVDFLPDSMNRVSFMFSISGTLDAPEFSPKLTDNLLQGLEDIGSDWVHDVGDSFTGFDSG